MAITVGELAVLLSAKDQMTSVLKGVQGEMAQTEKSGLSMSKVLGGIGVAAAAGVGAVTAIGGALVKLAMDAAPVESVRAAFQGISGDADTMLEALQKGSMGMVSQTDLMKSYNSAAQLVSVTFANQLPSAMGYLSKVSAATGQDMGFMLDSLVKGVGRLSPMILDNLGIQVALSEATDKAAQMYGKEAEELSKAETQAGMMAVVMEKLAANTAAMPDVMGTLNQQIASSKVLFEDTKLAIGEAFIPVLSELARAVLPPVTSALLMLVPIMRELAAWMGDSLPSAIAWLRGAIDQTVPSVNGIAGSLRDTLGAALAAVKPVLDDLTLLWERNWPRMQAVVRNVLDDVVPFIKAMIADAAKFMQTTFGGLIAWWEVNFPLIQQTVSKVLTFIRELWHTVWPALSTALKAVWEIMKTTVETFIGNILSIIRAVMLIINGDWEGAWEEIKSFLGRTWEAMKHIIATALDFLLGLVGTSLENIKNKFTNIDWGAVGRGIIDGIGGGIANAAGNLAQAAADAARRALDAAKSFLGIGSPSRVAAAEIGVPFVEGIGVGIDSAAPDLMSTVADMTRDMADVAANLTNIGGYQAQAGLGGVVDAFIADLRTAGKKLVDWFKLWKEQTFANVEMSGQASALLGDMFGPVKQWVDGVVAIGEYQKAADIGRAVTDLIADARASGKQLVEFFKLWKDQTFANVEMGGKAAEALAALFAPAKAIVDGVMAIASYQKAANIGMAVADLIADARKAGKALVTYFLIWTEQTFANVEQATKAAEAMAGLFAPAKTLVDGVGAIGEYQKSKRLSATVATLIADARKAGKALVTYFLIWTDSTFGNVEMATSAASAMAGLFNAIQEMAGHLSKIVELPEIQPAALEAGMGLLTGFADGFADAVNYLANSIVGTVAVLNGMIQKAMPDENKLQALIDALLRTLAMLKQAASLQSQIRTAMPGAGVTNGNITLPPSGGVISPAATTTKNYTLNVNTSQPAVNIVSSFKMLEAMA